MEQRDAVEQADHRDNGGRGGSGERDGEGSAEHDEESVSQGIGRNRTRRKPGFFMGGWGSKQEGGAGCGERGMLGVFPTGGREASSG